MMWAQFMGEGANAWHEGQAISVQDVWMNEDWERKPNRKATLRMVTE